MNEVVKLHNKRLYIKNPPFNREKYQLIQEEIESGFAGLPGDKNLSIYDVVAKRRKWKNVIENLKKLYPDVEETIESFRKKYDICVNESLALFLRDCYDGSLAFCDLCLEGKCTMFSIKLGWQCFCSPKCFLSYKTLKVMKDLTLEEKKHVVEIKNKFGLGSFEEAKLFIDNGYKKNNQCKICKRPTKFISYHQKYRIFCEWCRIKISEFHIEEDRKKRNNSASIAEVHQNIKKYGHYTCYEYMVKNQLKKLSQAAWHLSRGDENCIFGLCPHCGKRKYFYTFSHGYSKDSCSCNFRKNINVIRRSRLIKVDDYYKILFYRKLSFYTNRTDINGERIKREFNRIICEEERKKFLIKSRLSLLKKWGVERSIDNPIIKASSKKHFYESKIEKLKKNHEKKGYDPTIYDLYEDPNWWYQLYVVDEMTIEEICYYTGLSEFVVKGKLKKFNLLNEKNINENEEFDYEDIYDDLMIPVL